LITVTRHASLWEIGMPRSTNGDGKRGVCQWLQATAPILGSTIHLESRRIDIAGITDHPNERWMLQMARNATLEGCGALQHCRYLLHNRDTNTPPPSGRLSKQVTSKLYLYRLESVRSVKDECLSKIILFDDRSLRRAMSEYVTHYHTERNHQGKSNVVLSSRHGDARREAGAIPRATGWSFALLHQEAA
jgi:putative transposase